MIPTLINPVTRHDAVERLVGSYAKITEHLAEVASAAHKADRLYQSLGGHTLYAGSRGGITLSALYGDYAEMKTAENTRKAGWSMFFATLELDRHLSDHRRRLMQRHQDEVLNRPFTRENIYIVLDEIGGMWDSLHAELIADAFDTLTRNAKNRVYNRSKRGYGTRGHYATNDGYMVGKKVIVRRPTDGITHGIEPLNEVERALAWVTGTRYNPSATLTNKLRAVQHTISSGDTIENQYWIAKVYSETLHLKWKNDNVRLALNREYVAIKGAALHAAG